jgi:hypothetical protein
MATEEQIRSAIAEAIAKADETHGKPHGFRELSVSIGDTPVLVGAVYDALAKAKMLRIDAPKKREKR